MSPSSLWRACRCPGQRHWGLRLRRLWRRGGRAGLLVLVLVPLPLPLPLRRRRRRGGWAGLLVELPLLPLPPLAAATRLRDLADRLADIMRVRACCSRRMVQTIGTARKAALCFLAAVQAPSVLLAWSCASDPVLHAVAPLWQDLSCQYPPGVHSGMVMIGADDVRKLRSGEYISDNLIDLYMR